MKQQTKPPKPKGAIFGGGEVLLLGALWAVGLTEKNVLRGQHAVGGGRHTATTQVRQKVKAFVGLGPVARC